MKGPNKIIKQRYDVCVFNRQSGEMVAFLESTFRHWAADPFVVEKDDGSFYCFVEYMDNHVKHGEIAVFDSSTKKINVVIKEPFHMSFPFIFQMNDSFYMMPETSATNDLRLYKAVSFPFEWKLEKIILKDRKLVDSVLFSKNNSWFLLVYDIRPIPYRLEAYQFDMNTFSVGKMIGSIKDATKSLRPAGCPFEEAEELIFPTQEGMKSYGKDVLFNRLRVDSGLSVERIPHALKTMPSISSKYDHKHTYNVTKNLATLDFSKLVFSPLQIIDGLPCALKRIFKRKQK